MLRRRLILLTGVIAISVPSTDALAHWCSNIFGGAARFVVKPEKSSLVVPSSGDVPLKVYVQNNFPYKLFSVSLHATASGFTVTDPTGSKTIHPGQNVSYEFRVSGGGTLSTGTMYIQLSYRNGTVDDSDWVMSQTPSQSSLASSSVFGQGNAQQSPSLNAGKLADMFPSATLGSAAPTFGRTGIQQLILMFGYRFCFDSGGGWRCGGQNCPTPCAQGSAWSSIDQWGQDCLRAGAELGMRRTSLGSNLDAARAGASNALVGGSPEHKCMAAVVGAYLWQGASDTSTFTNALTSNSVPAGCVSAAQRILGSGSQSTCASGSYYERAACGAAEGIMNNNGPVTGVLMPNAGDGDNTQSYNSLYYAYMLSLVSGIRRAASGYVNYYPDAGGPTAGCTGPADCNDNNACTTDTCNTTSGACTNAPISGCCTGNSQCNDNNVCTNDVCDTTAHTCSNPAISGCCTGNTQCNDNNVCTNDVCSTTSHTCSNPAITGCCTGNTQCNDNVACTTDTCNTTTHTCVFTPQTGCCTGNTQCNDNNPCTTDTCNTTAGTCSNAPIASCCTLDTQCNDSNLCTTDTCNTTTHACQFAPVSGCCTTNTQCNDNNVCTTDSCNTTAHSCVFTPVSGCCTNNTQCNDNNVCTADTCSSTSHTCQFSNITGCCTSPTPCNDANSCTTDTCDSTSHTCQHQPVAGCCTTDDSCKDNNACTDDKCTTASGTCSNTKRDGCCAFDTDCDDSDSCTLDKCDTTSTTCSHTQTCIDQGTGPSDAGTEGVDRGAAPPTGGGVALTGGCTMAGGEQPGVVGVLLVFALLLLGRRRARRRP